MCTSCIRDDTLLFHAEPEVSGLNAATFAHTLFSLMRLPLLTFAEAFAMANHVLRAHGCADTGAKRNPIHPILHSAESPELPGTKPQPIPDVEGVDLSLGFTRSIPGAFGGRCVCSLCGGRVVDGARCLAYVQHAHHALRSVMRCTSTICHFAVSLDVLLALKLNRLQVGRTHACSRQWQR